METKPRLVYIEWIDSSSVSHWNSVDEIDKCCKEALLPVKTCGIVLRDDDDVIMIATSLSGTGEFHSGIAIPKLTVQMIQELES